jgi:hypothetical protein
MYRYVESSINTPLAFYQIEITVNKYKNNMSSAVLPNDVGNLDYPPGISHLFATYSLKY